MKTTKALRVSLAFGRGSDHKLEDTAGAVAANLYEIPAFENPPVEKPALEAAMEAFSAAIAAQAQGGTAATAEKHSRRQELVKLLRELAFFVQVVADDDMAVLLSSGFEAVRPTRQRVTLDKPTRVQIKNGISGQVLVTSNPVRNAASYQVDAALLDEQGTPGEWAMKRIHSGSRNIPVDELIPGRKYNFRVRAVGGLSGYSDWSDTVSHRSN